MSSHHDPELDDVLQDSELIRLARLLGSAERGDPLLDLAFRSALRRQLMQQADLMNARRAAGWRRLFAPANLAWAGAAVGLLLIASVVVFSMLQQPAIVNQLVVSSAINGSQGVQLKQPILVSFNQPMDQAATQASIQVTPATNVTYSWQDSNTLVIQPISGNLAPNTQYQVTVGPGAKTTANVTLATQQTITFVTQPQTPPTPSPSPSPTPGPLVSGEKQLATVGSATPGTVQWSPDSASVYFVTSTGSLDAVPAKGGSVTVIAPDAVTSQALSPAGDRLAYVRGGKIETVTISTGATTELVTAPPAIDVGWAKDKLVWTASDGVYSQGSTGGSQVAPLPSTGKVNVLSIAPDGTHVAYQLDGASMLLDVASGKSVTLGGAFSGWSPSGAQILLLTSAGTAVSDLRGNISATLAPSFGASWSTSDAILLGGDAALSQVRPDGSSSTKLADGSYDSPAWAPDGATFAFFRGGAIWVASAPALPPQTTSLDQAAAVVNSFMQARLKGQADQAGQYLDPNGKQAYGTDGLNLTISGDPSFTRYYILTQEITSTQPDTAKFVVRIVLSHQKLEVTDVDETLTLVRDPSSNHFVVDQAAAGPRRDAGKGAEVVAIDVTRSVIKVTFDSDLDPSTVARGVMVVGSNGDPVDATASYANRVVTLSGLDLKPGEQYKLVVSTALRDVLGHNVTREYDLVLLGPAAGEGGSHLGGSTAAPSPSPSPSPSPVGASPNPSPGG
ncbi:MAG: Ig-like domain-containing protein [Candidatus Dormibacterales bacterium]